MQNLILARKLVAIAKTLLTADREVVMAGILEDLGKQSGHLALILAPDKHLAGMMGLESKQIAQVADIKNTIDTVKDLLWKKAGNPKPSEYAAAIKRAGKNPNKIVEMIHEGADAASSMKMVDLESSLRSLADAINDSMGEPKSEGEEFSPETQEAIKRIRMENQMDRLMEKFGKK